MELPRYDDLPVTPGAPPGSSWGLWGAADVFGCLNLLTAERVVAGAHSVRSGKVFPLSWNFDLPNPPLFGRSWPTHRVTTIGEWHDDEITEWNTQGSSQWDGFRHVRSDPYGYYSGIADEEHGIHHWARRGIVGRGVLVDVGRWRERIGRPLSMFEADPITAEELSEAISSMPVSVQPGDILLVRTGWTESYEASDDAVRRHLAQDLNAPGLQPGEDLLRLLWDLHIAAIVSDNPSVELDSSHRSEPVVGPDGHRVRESDSFAHYALLPLLGLPLGEMFDLSDLAADCAQDGVYEGLFTAAPLNLSFGVASPANALFVK